VYIVSRRGLLMTAGTFLLQALESDIASLLLQLGLSDPGASSLYLLNYLFTTSELPLHSPWP
jgi:hypothetical protein